VFVNTFNVLNELRSSKLKHGQIFCNGVNPMKVNRNRKSKWFVTWEEYPEVKYDRYCTGFFLLISRELIPAMYKEAPYVKFFWIDDYWMTGMVGKIVKSDLIFLNNHILINPFKIRTNYEKRLPTLYGVHTDHDINFLTEMWDKILLNHGYVKKDQSNFERFMII